MESRSINEYLKQRKIVKEFSDSYVMSNASRDMRLLYMENLLNLKNISDIFDLNSSVENCALYYYCYTNGYLSYNHRFTYDKKAVSLFLLPLNDLGFFISSGYGVCRNITFQLRDFLKIKEIKSYVAITDSRKFSLSPRIVTILVNLFPTVFGVHVLNYIKDEDTFFLYYPTNDIFPKVIDYSLLQYPNSKVEPVWIIDVINEGIISPLIKKRIC